MALSLIRDAGWGDFSGLWVQMVLFWDSRTTALNIVLGSKGAPFVLGVPEESLQPDSLSRLSDIPGAHWTLAPPCFEMIVFKNQKQNKPKTSPFYHLPENTNTYQFT